MKLTIDTQKLPGIQISLTAAEVTAQLRRLMHAEDLYVKDGCVYRGRAFLSNGEPDVEAVRAIETIEEWLRKQYPQKS